MFATCFPKLSGLFVFASSLAAAPAFAADAVDARSLERLVRAYERKGASELARVRPSATSSNPQRRELPGTPEFALDRCRPDADASVACVEEVNRSIPSYQRDDLEEINEILRACRGNDGAACLIEAKRSLPSYQYDDRAESVRLANACKGYGLAACLRSVKSSLASYQYDDLAEVEAILRSCSGR